MSIQLGSEPRYFYMYQDKSLIPMSIQLGSELIKYQVRPRFCLIPMSIQLGSEPLFSNLYLILT